MFISSNFGPSYTKRTHTFLLVEQIKQLSHRIKCGYCINHSCTSNLSESDISWWKRKEDNSTLRDWIRTILLLGGFQKKNPFKPLFNGSLIRNQLLRFVEDLCAIKVFNLSEVVCVRFAAGKLSSTPINTTHRLSRPNLPPKFSTCEWMVVSPRHLDNPIGLHLNEIKSYF